MLLEINSKTFSKALKIASKIASKKTHIQATSGILLEATENSFSIKATNLEVSFGATLEASISKSGSTSIDAVKLNALISTYAGDNIPLTLNLTKKGLSVTCEDSKQVLSTMPAGNFPDCNLGENFPNSLNVKDFAAIIKRTSFLVADIEDKPHLSGINISVNNNTFRATATDALRVATASFFTSTLPSNLDVTIPKLALAEIVAILPEDDTLHFGASDNKFFLKCGNYNVSSIISAQKFPNISAMFLEGNKISINRSSFLKALTRTEIFSDKKSLDAEIMFNKNSICIKAESAEGSSDQTLAIENSEEFSSRFRIKQISDFLSAIESDTVDFIYDLGVKRYNLTEPKCKYNSRYVLFPIQPR